jgi:hypothetical protein
MLFDLRGRGRRRTVQVIYVGLAILMGGGLVLFGIGSSTNGGLFDAFSSNNGSANGQIQKRVDKAQESVKLRPNDARAWGELATSEYQLAGQSKGYDQTNGTFTGDARSHLVNAQRAWERHLKLAGSKADPALAATMRNALTALGNAGEAVRAQEIVIDGLPSPGFGDYAQLAQLAYLAGQNRKGDLAANRAKELAPKDQKKDIETQLQAVKAQAAQQAAGATGGTAAAPGG